MIKEETRKEKRVVFLDIDGVLANCSHRLHYLDKKDYDSFYKEVVNDVPYVRDRTAVNEIESTYNGRVVLLTGRPERTREDTMKWLREYYDLPEGMEMLMRDDKDHRKSPELKSELALTYVENHDVRSCMVIDDMEDNVRAVVDAISDAHPSIRVIGARAYAPEEEDGEA